MAVVLPNKNSVGLTGNSNFKLLLILCVAGVSLYS